MDVDFGKVINKNQLLGWRWAPLCDAVRRSPVLSDGAKILYNEIVSFMWQKDNIRAWPNQQTLADNLSISRQAVSRRLKELEATGLVGIQRNGLGKSSDIYLYDLDLSRLQVEQDDTGVFRAIPQSKSTATTTVRVAPPSEAPGEAPVVGRSGGSELPPKVNGSEPVIPPDVTFALHPDVKETLHLDVTLPLHLDVTSATRDQDGAEASGSDVADVPEIEISAEEETGNIINREEEAAAPPLSTFTTSGSAKPNLPIIQRGDIPKGISPTWNPALTEESVVIDGERFLVEDDEQTSEVEAEVETSEAELPDPETELPLRPTTDASPGASLGGATLTVEAETSDEDIAVNQGKMAQLVSGIGQNLTSKPDDVDKDGAPPRMSREEMLAKLQEMDWRAGIDGETDDEV